MKLRHRIEFDADDSFLAAQYPAGEQHPAWFHVSVKGHQDFGFDFDLRGVEGWERFKALVDAGFETLRAKEEASACTAP